MSNFNVLVVVLLAAGQSILAHAGVCNVVNGKAYGDCSGVTFNTDPVKDIHIRSFRSVTGIVGDVTVYQGGELDLSGIANRITVKRGGLADIGGVCESLTVHGTANVSGIVANVKVVGGSFTLLGQAGSVTGAGEINFKKHSVIGGVPQKGHRISRRSKVADVQSCLTFLGYKPGLVDGLSGRRTRSAIRAYQRARNANETGQWVDVIREVLLECESSGWISRTR